MADRGVIGNREAARQIYDFSGLQYRDGITPTDIDGIIMPQVIHGCIEFKNNCYVLYEFKKTGVTMKSGQRLAFERICNDLLAPAVCVVCLHDTPYDEDVDCAVTKVAEWYFNGKWKTPKGSITCKQFTDGFLEKFGKVLPVR